MKKRYFICNSAIHLSDAKRTLYKGRYLLVSRGKVFIPSKGKLKEISSQGDWVISKAEKGFLIEKSEKEFNEFLKSDVKKEVKAVNSTTDYQEVVTHVKVDDRIKRVDAHKAFSQPLASPSVLRPPKTASEPRVETKIHTNAVTKEKPAYSVGSGSKVSGELAEKFVVIDTSELKKANPFDSESAYKKEASKDLIVADKIDPPVKEDKEEKSHREKWEEYVKLSKKAQRISFIGELTYPKLLMFFIDKTAEIVSTGELDGRKLTANLKKMHQNLMEIMESQLKLARFSA